MIFHQFDYSSLFTHYVYSQYNAKFCIRQNTFLNLFVFKLVKLFHSCAHFLIKTLSRLLQVPIHCNEKIVAFHVFLCALISTRY